MTKDYKGNEAYKETDEQQSVVKELDTISNKKRVILLAGFVAVIVVILVVIIVKISSKPKEVQESETTVQTQDVEDVKPVEVREEEPESQSEPAVELEPEVEEEVVETPEPTVYEGIDMESTLPGNEWIKTFLGVIDEPKLVVYNDTNNTKIILEDKQEVKFTKYDDIFAIYLPNGIESMFNYDYNAFCGGTYADEAKAILLNDINTAYKEKGKVTLEHDIKDENGELQTLTCTLVFTE